MTAVTRTYVFLFLEKGHTDQVVALQSAKATEGRRKIRSHALIYADQMKSTFKRDTPADAVRLLLCSILQTELC